MQFHSKPPRRVVINITSLIDVIFMLLMFFVVTSTFLEAPGIKLELPASRSAEVGPIQKFILYVTADGRYSLNGEFIRSQDLQARLAADLPKMLDGALTLYADKQAQHGAVVQAMDAARLAGVKRLIVATAEVGNE